MNPSSRIELGIKVCLEVLAQVMRYANINEYSNIEMQPRIFTVFQKKEFLSFYISEYKTQKLRAIPQSKIIVNHNANLLAKSSN